MADWQISRSLPVLFGLLIGITTALFFQTKEKVVFNARTTTGESYYIGQPLTVTCKPSWSSLGKFGVALEDHSRTIYIRREGVFSNLGHFLSEAQPKVQTGIHYKYSSNRFPGSTTTIVFNISEELAAYRLRCVNVYGGGPVSDSSLRIGAETVKEPPQNLVMSVSPESVIENQTLTVTCSSSSSQSSYIYQVVRGNTVTRISNGIYTSSVRDRGGFSVKCIDTANEAWRVISAADVEVTTEVFPKYITRNWRLADYRKLEMIPTNPSTILCDIGGHPTPTYTWTSNVSSFEAVTEKELLISTYSRNIGDVEKITCTASVDGVTSLRPTLITWIIYWHNPSTKPPTRSSGATIVGAVAACIMLISIFLLFWCKKDEGAGNLREKLGRLRRKMLTSRSVAPTETVYPQNNQIMSWKFKLDQKESLKADS